MQQQVLEIKETWGERPASASRIVMTDMLSGGLTVTVYEPHGIGRVIDAVVLIRDINDIRKMRDFLNNIIKE